MVAIQSRAQRFKRIKHKFTVLPGPGPDLTYDLALRGFQRVTLAPGETKRVSFTLSRRDLELYNRDRAWVVEPGRFTAMLGASSTDLRLRGNFTVTAPDGTAPEEAPLADDHIDPR